MVALFAVFFIALLSIYWKLANFAFGLILFNLFLCLLFLIHHSTNLFKMMGL